MEAAEVRGADWLPILRPHLSRSLTDAGALRRLGELWRRFPGDLLTAIELRLKADSPRVDSALRLESPQQLYRIPRRFFPAGGRASLGNRWSELGHPTPISALWLELDLDGPTVDPGEALLCARLEGRVDPEWLVAALLPMLRGRPLASAQAAVVRRAVEVLPPEARVLYAFSLRPRSEEAVRLELIGLGPDAWGPYLEALGSPRSAARVAALAPWMRGADRYHLSFDVEDRVLPRIGVECGWRRLPVKEPGWRRVLDRWVAAGIADPAKRDAILAWPGQDTLWSEPRRWPAGAIRRGGHLVRCVSHFKLVSRPDREPEAKAYLLFRHLVPRRQDGDAARTPTPSSAAIRSASRA